MNSTVVVIPSYPQEESSGQILANEMEDEEMENEDTQIIEINPKSIEQLCRTCLCKLDLIPIDTSTISSGEKLSFLLELCLSLKVDPSDPLPKNICANCVNEIQRFYYFRKQCHLNESTLKLILTSSAADSDDDSPNDDKYDLNTREEEEGDSGCRDSRLDETATVIFNKDTKEWDHNYGKQIFKNETEMSENSDDEVVEKLIIRNDSNDENEDNDAVKEETTLNDVKQVKEYFSCNGCDDLFASRGEMQRHKREANHSKESSSYMCEICSKIVTSRFKLNAHLRSHTKEKPYKCNMCSSMFSLAGNLMRHMKTHTGEKPHICEFCGKGSIRPDILSHQKCRQIYQKPVSELFNKCNRCGINFRIRSIYIKHIKKCGKGTNVRERRTIEEELMVTDENEENIKEDIVTTYMCTFCHEIYLNRSNLICHCFYSHPDEVKEDQISLTDFWPKRNQSVDSDRYYRCTLCTLCLEIYPNRKNLIRHYFHSHPEEVKEDQMSLTDLWPKRNELVHSDRPYQCDLCQESFKYGSTLMSHRLVHTAEKPYKCEYCKKDFSSRSNLTVHTRLHTDEKPFACSICDRLFYTKEIRKRHCNIAHRINLINEESALQKHVEGTIDYKP